MAGNAQRDVVLMILAVPEFTWNATDNLHPDTLRLV
jgi:hypothetical protein